MHWQDGDKVEPAVLVNPASSMDAIPAANLRDLTNDSSLQQVSVVNYEHATIKAMERSAASLGFAGALGGGHSSNGSSTMGQMLRKSYDEDLAFQDKLNYAKHRSPPKGGAAGAKGNLIGGDTAGPSKTKAADIKAAASRGVNNKGGSVSGAKKGEPLSVALLGGHKASVVSQQTVLYDKGKPSELKSEPSVSEAPQAKSMEAIENLELNYEQWAAPKSRPMSSLQARQGKSLGVRGDPAAPPIQDPQPLPRN